MSWKNTPDRYGSAMIALHWLMLLMIIGVYTCIELRELYPKDSDPREALKTWHFMLGLSVFSVLWLRLCLSLFQATPQITPRPGRWQRLLASGMHIALYFLMMVMPIAGWLILSAEGKDIPFFGMQLPALMPENETLGETIEEAHKLAGKIGYFLIGLHAAAALVHHYIQRDDTLSRMLPGR